MTRVVLPAIRKDGGYVLGEEHVASRPLPSIVNQYVGMVAQFLHRWNGCLSAMISLKN